MIVARNILANIVGVVVLVGATAATTILSFRIAGAEQYGLIGFYLTLHGIIAILDTGLGPAVVREVARVRAAYASNAPHPESEASVLFTFQGLYVVLTVATALAFILLTPLIATKWLSAQALSVAEIEVALILAALTIGLQRLRTVYSIFLEGLERQVLTNLLQSGGSCVRAAAVLGAMLAIAPTAIVFLGTTLLVSAGETAVTAYYAWRAADRRGAARAGFSFALVRRMRRYLATNSSAVALGGAIQGLDKVIVSALVPLDVVGRYMFISQICLIVVKLVTPNVTAVFPRLTAYVHTHDRTNAKKLYFAASQMTAAFVATFAVGATFFGAEMLFTLTGDRDFAVRYQMFFSVLAWGYSLYSLGLLPNALQQVEGHPETLFWNNLIGALLYLPLVAVATPIYGIIAPALLWLTLTAVWLAIFAWRAHRHFLAGMAWPWVRSSLLAQIIPVAVTLTAAKMMIRADLTVAALAQTIAAGMLACVLAVLASPDLRGAIVDAGPRLPFRRLPLNGSRSDVRA